MHVRMALLRVVRSLTQYVLPGLITVVIGIEVAGSPSNLGPLSSVAYAYYSVVLVLFCLLTAIMIAICGWIVFLWDLDRLFFKLEGKIDAHLVASPAQSGEAEQ